MQQTVNPWVEDEGKRITALRESIREIVEAYAEHAYIARTIVEAAPLDKRLEQEWQSFMRRWDDAVEARIVAQQQDGLISSFNARWITKVLNSLDVNLVVAAFGRPRTTIRATF